MSNIYPVPPAKKTAITLFMFWRDDIDPGHEPHKIRIERGDLFDGARAGRRVPYKIYYPLSHGLPSLPVIIWSHGLGGSRDGAAYLSRFIASHGYAVVHPTHTGTDTGLWEGKPGHPWDVIRATHISRKATLNRFRDIPFLLDSLPGLAKEKPEIGKHMDLSRIGMSGHSFGAVTTQVMCGQMLGKGRRMYSLKDERIKCAIAYSMGPTYNRGEPAEKLYGPMDVPMLFMTGTNDDSPISGKDYTARLPIYEHAGSKQKHLLVLEEADHMVFAGSRGKLGTYDKLHLHQAIIKIVSLAFWDAYLRKDTAAMDWLTKSAITAFLNGEGRYENIAKIVTS